MIDAIPAAESTPRVIRIGTRRVGEGAPVFVIAELGLNHDGNVDRARELIDHAVDAGADAVKFQMRSPADLYVNGGDPEDPSEDLGVQYVLDIVRRSHLDRDAMFTLFEHVIARGVECLCTPWDLTSLRALEEFGLPALKVASADLTNHELLDAMASTSKPLLVSTGMSREQEIREAVSLLRGRGVAFALLHCVSAYPPPLRDIHLRYLERLRRLGGGCPVGYSGHELGWVVAVAAVALGATVIEKHLTLDRSGRGVDNKISLLPHEFRDMVTAIREVEDALGGSNERRMRHGERINRQSLAKSLVARRPVEVGEVITRDMIVIRSPGRGLQPNRLGDVLGRRARTSKAPNEPFFESDVTGPAACPRPYRFHRPWGVPVRYHDLGTITRRVQPDFVEFHLGDRDLDEDPDRFLAGPFPFGFVVHSPDQFVDDVVLDCAADDPAVRERSVKTVQRVVDLTRALCARFPRTPRPLVVTNLGGFSFDRPLPRERRYELYERVAAGLACVDTAGVEVIAQTLPPFPWHFGGRRVGNLFVDAEDTAWFCERFGYRLCLDVAHTSMAATHAGATLHSYAERLAPHAAHLHLCDAAGVDGEGLQIGDGAVDFAGLAVLLDRLAPGIGFIPEVWEGHVNGGEKFWWALDRLERWFGRPSFTEGMENRGLV